MSVEVVTFGCRLNGVESEAMRRAAVAAGHEHLVIVNTCAVTAEAVRQARQTIRRLARERPEVVVAVTGCAAQIDPAAFAAMPEVSRVIGNALKTQTQTWSEGAPVRVDVPDFAVPGETTYTFTDASAGLEGHTRAFVEIQNGCDHRCTFCIIPYGRGPSRSVPMGAVVAQVRSLVEAGFLEVVLTGVDITAYGADLPGRPRLGRLVHHVLAGVPDLARLRLSSIDSVEVDAELLAAFGAQSRLMPHLHLSLQSGDDLVLARMKRRHRRADAVAFCAELRRLRPEVVLGADIIAGFPTETEAMFTRSLDLVADCGLTHLHVFPFSARPGTPAARMPPVAGRLIKERAARLRAAGAAALDRHLAAQAGRRVDVLTERGGSGRTRDFTAVRITGVEPGRLITAEAVGQTVDALLVRQIEPSILSAEALEPVAAR